MEKRSWFDGILKSTFGSCLMVFCDYFYDTLSGVMSVLDVLTDVMILIYYYESKKEIFFMLSLSILVLSQLSYASLFLIRFASHLSLRNKVMTFILVLPFCPFMSYILYWASLRNNKLSRLLQCIGLQCSEYEPPSEKQAEKLGITKLQEYFAEKLVNHTGFVLQALCESFPQSVLQSIAMIVYYDESTYYENVLSFISILISLISISSKALMLSGSLNVSTFFFNWLCAICDLFGLYLIFVWVLHHSNSLSLFAWIWLWKFVVCTVVPIAVGTFLLAIFIAIDLYDDMTLAMYKESVCEYICKFWIIVGIMIIFAVLWSFAVLLLIIFGEVLCCTWIAIGFYYYNESRFSHSRTFMKIFSWLYLSANAHDLMIRLIAVNYRLSHTKMMNDTQLHSFLKHVIQKDLHLHHDGDYYEEYEGNFRTSLLNCDDHIASLSDITYKDFRIRCKNRHKTHLVSLILKQMAKATEEDKHRLSELNQQQTYVYGINILEIRIAKLIVYLTLIADYILWFIFVPLYAVSRIFNLAIPIIAILLSPQIEFFQWILTAFFFVLLLGLIVLFPSVWKFQFLAWHVAPGYSIISPKIHNDNSLASVHKALDGDHDSDYKEEEECDEYTTTLEDILSDRSTAQQNTTNRMKIGNGTRRARRIRRKHKRQQRKQKKKNLKRIREKIRKYEKLEFYEWVKEFYSKCISIPMIRTQIMDRFGTDIGSIILMYLPSIVDEDDNVVMKEVIDDEIEISKSLSESYHDIMDNNNNSSHNTSHMMDWYSNHTNSNSLIDEDIHLLPRNQSILCYEDFATNADRNCNNVDLSQLLNTTNADAAELM
eukprot:132958_1